MIRRELEVVECGAIIFEHLLRFRKEIDNPLVIKKDMDLLIKRLKKKGYYHTNRVITRVLEKDSRKKTIKLEIIVPVVKDKDLMDFIAEYPQYEYVEKYIMPESIKISIANDPEQFQQAVQKFTEYAKLNDQEKLDLQKNHIIEIAKIDLNGNVVAFDLHMEKISKEEASHASVE
ncbi:MAG: hypothetical protein FWJ66_04125 [Caldibacillus sp.]